MFNDLWVETKGVKIVDTSVDAFKEFLQFFYLTDIKLTMENIAEVIYLGKKYNVADCSELCTKFLRNTLNEDKVCDGYKLAIDYEQKGLKNFCEAMIGINTNAVFTSEGFLQCDPKVLSHIVLLVQLSCTEMELFETCMRRVNAAEKERLLNENASQIYIRSLFKGFRFGTLSLEELATLGTSHYEHFSFAEYIKIVNMISSEEFQPKLLNGIREKRIGDIYFSEMETVYCDRIPSSNGSLEPYFIKDIETTTSFTNQPILLTKIISMNMFGRSELDKCQLK